ncbi:hypothetical protein [Merismopedia glauca]|uniref:Uncharacterized protein n=1 Tax=Merismopedia glauca CCAP 1448/3 TaxID=1296344 RepID=A0A2T1C750_9CYAN|nr:hypothetical protein [Merismopedia glauca]PSB04081.1 hypothetical protein C7B64_05455 [Merismopedia glauca CCAP 1448/3]
MSTSNGISQLFFWLTSLCLASNLSCSEQLPAKSEPPPDWSEIQSIKMDGDLKVFWGVAGRDSKYNLEESIKHGFTQLDGLNPYADPANRQKNNINRYLQQNKLNPWEKPSFFEEVIKRNLSTLKNSDYLYQDIEFVFNTDINKAWNNREIRQASGTDNIEDFKNAYFKEWATWFSLPLKWAKDNNSDQKIGLYGVQVFSRDYHVFLRSSISDIPKTKQADLDFWKYLDDYVDFYLPSIYVFYDKPDSIYYMAANVEENYLRSRRFGNKPVYPFIWLRYHNGGDRKVAGKELNPYLVEASAVLPFFTGGKGFVLWGWEPKTKGQYYHSLPTFMNSLSRVAQLSSKISRAKLVIDQPAYVLWRTKQPLVRKLKVSNKEWIVMAIYPWQNEAEEKTIKVSLGSRSVNLKIKGRHTEIYHLDSRKTTRLSMRNQAE